MMGGGEKKKKQLSGAQKRKKKKEKEDLAAEMERLKLGPSKLWTGLVLHHKDVFVTHVIPKLNTTDRWFFSEVNRESQRVLEYAGVNVSGLGLIVYECSSISTLEWAWNHIPWGEKFEDGTVRDQAWFCSQVAATNKLELQQHESKTRLDLSPFHLHLSLPRESDSTPIPTSKRMYIRK